MFILKDVFLATLRIVFFGSLKLALFVYTLSLPEMAFTGTGPQAEGAAE